MAYLMEFFGLLLVAIALAASPLLMRVFEYLLPRGQIGSRSAPSRAPARMEPEEGRELRDEIRRLTRALEMDRRAPRS